MPHAIAKEKCDGRSGRSLKRSSVAIGRRFKLCMSTDRGPKARRVSPPAASTAGRMTKLKTSDTRHAHGSETSKAIHTAAGAACAAAAGSRRSISGVPSSSSSEQQMAPMNLPRPASRDPPCLAARDPIQSSALSSKPRSTQRS
eukprot:scaffold65578_cov66-Phaeocystis_antarctica.AAC.2